MEWRTLHVAGPQVEHPTEDDANNDNDDDLGGAERWWWRTRSTALEASEGRAAPMRSVSTR